MHPPQVDGKKSLYASRRFTDTYNDSQMLRRRSSSRAEHLTQSEDGNLNNHDRFSDTSRPWGLHPLPLNSQHSRGSLNNINSFKYDEVLDTVPLTPNIYSRASGLSSLGSKSGSSTTLPIPAGLPIDKRFLDVCEMDWRPVNSTTEPEEYVYSAKTVESDAAVLASPSAEFAQSRPKLGVLNKLTNKWPEPLPLKAATKRSHQDEWDLSEEELEKSVDVLLLESGIGPGSGMLGLEWFNRWTSFKWCLLFSVLSVLVYGIAGLSCAVGIWFRTLPNADVIYVADNDVLILITLATSILVFTALVGLTGTLLSSRPILAIYALLLWSCFISMCAIGYTAYKRATFALEQKLDMSWSQYYTPYGRLFIQNSLKCCGWLNPNHGGTASRTCYPRTPLPGCKGPLLRFEQANLQLVWSTVFSLVPMHLVNIVVVMLCANHVTRTFGSGITPKRYRLTARDVQEDAGRILNMMMKGRQVSAQNLGRVRRPSIVKASSSRVFREDKDDTTRLLDPYPGY